MAVSLIAAPLAAETETELLGDLQALQADDARLQSIGYRLATANAAFCDDRQPTSGLLLADMRNFDQPDRIRQAMKLNGDFAVQALAKGSPAANSGATVGDEVVSLDGEVLAALPARRANDTGRIVAVQDRIDRALSAQGAFTLGLRGQSLRIAGQPACRARFEVQTSGQGANGGRIVAGVSQKILSLAASDDEAAFVTAHELAHVLLRHSARLAAQGRKVRNVLVTEREADRLALWLMANAGFDPAAAPVFLRHWGPKGLAGLFQEPTHDRTETRARAAEAELGILATAPKTSAGQRDWRGHFKPFVATATARP
ncbi:MAG: M48 family metalloprotease [Novosphingobium sp.]